MKTATLVTALIATGILISATAATVATVSSGPAPDVGALQKRIDQWLDGYNKADVAQMMDVFSADFSDARTSSTLADASQCISDCSRTHTTRTN